MKRILVYLLCACILVFPLAGCGKQAPEYRVTVEGAIFGGSAGKAVETTVSFDPAWITKNSNTEYNKDLAAFSAILCADSYYREKDLAKGTQNRVLPAGETGEYAVGAFLSSLGYEDIEFIESFRAKEYEADGNDSVTLLLGHRKTDEKYDSYIAVIRGCFSAGEWASTFDPGFMGDTYTSLTGSHPEWTEKDVCKGFAVASARAAEFIGEYIAAHDDPACENTVLVTGHSRGGAIAGLTGAALEEKELKTYTYTFNAPAVADKSGVPASKTVFNLFDEGDFYVDPLPFADEEFCRPGRDLALSIAENAEVKAEIAALLGEDIYTCASRDVLDAYADKFSARFSDRESLYETKTRTETFGTREEADARKAELETLAGKDGLDLGVFCRTGEIREGSEGFELTVSYESAALLLGFAKTLAYGDAAYGAFVSLFKGDSACEIAELLVSNIPALTGGHLLANGFVLTQYVK